MESMKKANHETPVFLVERQGEILIVAPSRDAMGLVESNLRTELNALHELVEGQEIRHLVVDLGSSSFFDSLILGAVTVLGQRVRDRGGKAVLCNAHEEMYEVLQIIRFDTILPYFRSPSAALDFVLSH